MNKFEQRTRKKKEAIIAIALTLFTERGYSDVHIEEIARAASVSKVSIFTYFESKEGLLDQCIIHSMTILYSKAMTLLESPLPYREKLAAALNLCQLKNSEQASQLLMAELENRNKQAMLIHSKITAQKFAIYEAYIDFGIKQKEIKSSLTKRSIMILLEAINSQHKIKETDLFQIMTILFDGILINKQELTH